MAAANDQEMAVALRVFTHYIGINVDVETDLLPVAEKLFYDLPKDWKVGIGEDEHAGIPYFYNSRTGKSGWTHPKEEMCFRVVKQARRDMEIAKKKVQDRELDLNLAKEQVNVKSLQIPSLYHDPLRVLTNSDHLEMNLKDIEDDQEESEDESTSSVDVAPESFNRSDSAQHLTSSPEGASATCVDGAGATSNALPGRKIPVRFDSLSSGATNAILAQPILAQPTTTTFTPPATQDFNTDKPHQSQQTVAHPALVQGHPTPGEDKYASLAAREAWQILHEESSVLTGAQVQIEDILQSLGGSRAAYLLQLSTEETQQLARCLKALPARRFTALLCTPTVNDSSKQSECVPRREPSSAELPPNLWGVRIGNWPK